MSDIHPHRHTCIRATRRVRTFALALVMTLGAAFPMKPANAVDLVIDPALIAQTVTGYTQDLKNYAASLRQEVILGNQYVQMLNDYNQMLLEYRSYLNELRGIAHYFDNATWAQIFRQGTQFYGFTDFARITELNPFASSFFEELDRLLNGSGHYVPRNPADVLADARAVGMDEATIERLARAHSQGYDLYRDQMATVAMNANEIDSRKEKIANLGSNLRNLPDESTLATMQFMAMQNQLGFDQIEANNEILNQILAQQQMDRAEQLAKEAEGLDREIARLERLQSQPFQLLGRSRWGDF